MSQEIYLLARTGGGGWEKDFSARGNGADLEITCESEGIDLWNSKTERGSLIDGIGRQRWVHVKGVSGVLYC